jgi:hypothetical protein
MDPQSPSKGHSFHHGRHVRTVGTEYYHERQRSCMRIRGQRGTLLARRVGLAQRAACVRNCAVGRRPGRLRELEVALRFDGRKACAITALLGTLSGKAPRRVRRLGRRTSHSGAGTPGEIEVRFTYFGRVGGQRDHVRPAGRPSRTKSYSDACPSHDCIARAVGGGAAIGPREGRAGDTRDSSQPER